MIEGFVENDFLDWNYDFFRVHRVIPPIGTTATKKKFKLKDLQVAALRNNPSFGRSVLATLIVRMYDSLWIEIPPPKGLLTRPGDNTMADLAAFCHTKAKAKHPGGLSNEGEG